ncbi:MAG: phage holin family protein [Pseudomonadota bacterium]
MLKTVLKLVAQLLIARFIRNRVEEHVSNDAASHFGAVKKSVAALIESHAVLFKSQFNQDLKRLVNSFVGYMFILFAAFCSGITGLMWIFATAWNSPNRDIILGTTMILPIILGIAVFLVIRQSWKKQPLLQQSMIQIEQDWQVFRNGLDGTADTSDEANR